MSDQSADGPPCLHGGGTWIGRYLILRELGSGGMGVVYEAYDSRIDRRVALKLHHPKGQGGTEVGSAALHDAASRLVREAKALARLADPNVLTLYDVSTHEGQLILAMEMVRGCSLDHWLKVRRRTQAEIMRTLHEAARGLWAVHRAGLVHRDFKPENVLVADDGRVLVADFGLARDLGTAEETNDDLSGSSLESQRSGPISDIGSSGLTQLGDVLGTPLYMAPEQHLGQFATQRSDQFAFCVTAYEALTGKHPHRGRTRDAILARILKGPPPMGHRRGYVPKSLERALRRGLSVEAAGRFPDMQALMRALFEPRRPARRVLGWVCTAVALLALLWGQTQAGARLHNRCQRGASLAESLWSSETASNVAAAFTAALPGYAEQSFARVDQQFREFRDDWKDTYVSSCEIGQSEQSAHGTLAREFDERMSCLSRTIDHARGLVEQFEHPTSRTVREAVAAVRELPRPEDCDRSQTPASQRRPWPEAADARRAVARSRTELERIRLLAAAGHHPVALRELSELAQHLAGQPQQFRPLLAEVQFELGQVQLELHDASAAIEHFEAARLHARASGYRRLAFESLSQLILQYAYYQHDPVTGQRLLDEAEAQLIALGEPMAASIEIWIRRGLLHAIAGRHDDSVYAHGRAVELAREHYGELHPMVGTAYQRLASALWWRSDHAAAAGAYRRALDIESHLLGASHPGLARIHTNLAFLLALTGDYEAAVHSGTRAIALCASELGPEHLRCSSYNDNVASYHARRGEYDKAEALLVTLSRVQAREGRRAHPDDPWADVARAELALQRGQFQRAAEFARAGNRRTEEDPTATANKRVMAYRTLAACELALARFEATESALRKANEFHVPEDGEHGETMALLLVRGNLELARGNPATAQHLHADALARFTDHLCSDCPDLAPYLKASAESLAALGRFDEASEQLHRALGLLEDALPRNCHRTATYLLTLGELEIARGRLPEARSVLETALARFDGTQVESHIRDRIEVGLASLSKRDPPDTARREHTHHAP